MHSIYLFAPSSNCLAYPFSGLVFPSPSLLSLLLLLVSTLLVSTLLLVFLALLERPVPAEDGVEPHLRHLLVLLRGDVELGGHLGLHLLVVLEGDAGVQVGLLDVAEQRVRLVAELLARNLKNETEFFSNINLNVGCLLPSGWPGGQFQYFGLLGLGR